MVSETISVLPINWNSLLINHETKKRIMSIHYVLMHHWQYCICHDILQLFNAWSHIITILTVHWSSHFQRGWGVGVYRLLFWQTLASHHNTNYEEKVQYNRKIKQQSENTSKAEIWPFLLSWTPYLQAASVSADLHLLCPGQRETSLQAKTETRWKNEAGYSKENSLQ